MRASQHALSKSFQNGRLTGISGFEDLAVVDVADLVASLWRQVMLDRRD